MPDWTKSMKQTYEYYVVDPNTWKNIEKLRTVKRCVINRDSTVDTLGSVSLDMTGIIDECYVRAYLIVDQNGVVESFPLATFLIQTDSYDLYGKNKSVSIDAYTPLIELKEKNPEMGYSILKDENILDRAYRICRESTRAPVVKVEDETTLYSNFVSNNDDSILSFSRDLLAKAKYGLGLDEMGRVLFAPSQKTASLQPVFTFDDGNSSILYPEISLEQDMYGIPNVVEVTYSDAKNCYHARVVNDNVNSPVSTINRGREIVHRVINPDLQGIPSDEQIQNYAKDLMKELSTLERTVTYTHGYCPVRVGDCVRLNYERADLKNVKARVISQSIRCEPGCPVTEKAVFIDELWR